MANKTYLDLTGLGQYDAKIKAWVDGRIETEAYDDSAILALHADKAEGEGKQTVAQEVSAGIATVVADAPEAFDTLKEIADWIGSGDVQNTTAATMLADVEGLKTSVGAASVEAQGTEGEDGYVAPVAASGLYARVEELEAVNAAADTYTAITEDEIAALFAATADEPQDTPSGD